MSLASIVGVARRAIRALAALPAVSHAPDVPGGRRVEIIGGRGSDQRNLLPEVSGRGGGDARVVQRKPVGTHA